MHNIICFFVLVVVSVFFSMSSATDVEIFDVATLIVVPRPPPPQTEQTTPKGEGGKRRKRSIFPIHSTNIVNKLNSLRSSVGASDMNYMIYNSLLETGATNWTRNCNYDADIYIYNSDNLRPIYGIRSASLNPPDLASFLGTPFNDSSDYNALSSVYLQFVGADYTYCAIAQVENLLVLDVYLSAYLFSATRAYSSNFNQSQRQYTLGEQCTTCLSGSYWCYEGLCKDDCSASDSNCYCNSYCLNCAVTDSTTCRCRCLNGWIGSRCETANGVNTTTPTCSTTPRIPRTSTTSTTSQSTATSTAASTISESTVASTTSTTSKSTVTSTTASTTSKSTTTSTTKSATSESIGAATGSSKSGSSIGKSMFRLAFYAAVALLSKICTVLI